MGKEWILSEMENIIEFLKTNNGEKCTFNIGGFEDCDEQKYNIIDFALEVKEYIENVDEEAILQYRLKKIDALEKDLPF